MRLWSCFFMCFCMSCTAGAPLYLVKQGMGQATILWNRRPVRDVLADPGMPSDLKEKLLFMGRVRQFAKQRLQLQDTQSFQSYVEVPGEAVSYLVMAAPEFSLSPRTWWFPVAGEVPYLGFFDPSDADAFEEYLKGKGLDTYRGQAAAYSTLGWFADPVFSSQLRYSKAYLAGLVIHEMVHSTVWVKGQPEFNEALASFVEEKGRILYFEEQEDRNDPTLQRLLLYKKEEKRLNRILEQTAGELESLYASSLPEEEMRKEKKRLLQALKARLRSATGFTVIDTAALAEEDWNNARFIVRRVYRSDWPAFHEEFDRCQKDLACFIARYRAWAEDPEQNRHRFTL